MLLTLRTTHVPATDLGYLLHKNPDRVQSFTQSFGQAHVFYPEARDEACTAALLLDVDTVRLVRGKPGSSNDRSPLAQYVNDRPYVASSFLSVAMADVFRSALAGRSKERPALAETPLPLTTRISAIPCRGGEAIVRRLFEPLGYDIVAQSHPLDPAYPEWGPSPYWTVELSATKVLRDVLAHLYVLIPVLDDEKHYWVGSAEVEKLLRHGEGWLALHPEREMITNRYLRHRRHLVDDAIARLIIDDERDVDDVEQRDAAEATLERPLTLNTQRLMAVHAALTACGATRVIDLGCGEGQLLKRLLKDSRFTEILGMDVSYRMLEIATERLQFDRLPSKQRERIRLIHGSLMYRDARLTGFDAAAVVEVIEHLDPPRLAAFERVVFEFARPGTVVITTPNVEYNIRWATLAAGTFRHKDHRFEWTRAQFHEWATRVANRFGYTVRFEPIGPDESDVGSPTQMGIFTRNTDPVT